MTTIFDDLLSPEPLPATAPKTEPVAVDPTLPRGLRINNPGNIERNSIRWEGMAADQSADPRFAAFETPDAGVRAMARLLDTYQRRHGLDTVQKIINRWAPPVENDSGAYAGSVARSLGVRPDEPIDLSDRARLVPMLRAMIRHEQGRDPFTDEQISGWLDARGGASAAAGKPVEKPLPRPLTGLFDDLLVDPNAPPATAPAERMGRLRSGLGSFAQGMADPVAAIPKAAAIGGVFAADALGLGSGKTPKETSLYSAGEAIEQAVKRLAPSDPEYEQEFVAGKGPHALGQAATFMAGGAAGGALGLSRLGTAAALGAVASAPEGFEDALKHGASLSDAYKSSGLHALIGTSEGLPIMRALDRLDAGTGGSVRRLFTEAFKQGSEEAAQELFQTVSQNLVANKIVAYDPQRGTFTGTGEAAGIGFTVGGLMQLVLGAVVGRRGRQAETKPGEEPPPAEPPVEAPAPGQGPPVAPERAALPLALPAPSTTYGPDGSFTTRPSEPDPYDDVAPAELYREDLTETRPLTLPAPLAPDTTRRSGRSVQPPYQDVEPGALYREDVESGLPALPRPTTIYGDGFTARPAGIFDDLTAPPAVPVSRETIGQQPTPGEISPPAAAQEKPVISTPALPAGEFSPPPVAGPAPISTQELREALREPAPLPPIPAREAPPGEAEAVTPSGEARPVRYAVVEAGDLKASNLDDLSPNPAYPQELQPRDRTRAGTELQIQDMLNPSRFRPELLGPTPEAGSGAPIVSPEGVVESGNGRVMALRRAYMDQLPAAKRYRAWLEGQGYPVQGMTSPVLVRITADQMDMAGRAAFAVAANKPPQLTLSATERAMADARAMPPALMSLYRGGDLTAAGNREFVTKFLGSVPSQNERAGLIGKDGAISQDGIRRVQAAMLARAYEDPALVESLVESADNNIKSIGGALLDVSPQWAQMRDEARTGQIDQAMDITGQLLEAVRVVDRARSEGRNVAEYVYQQDVFAGRMDLRVEQFLRIFYRGEKLTGARGRDRIVLGLTSYVEEARKTTAGEGLFGGATKASPADVLGLAARKVAEDEGRPAAQPDLLAGRTQGDVGPGGGGPESGAARRGPVAGPTQPEAPKGGRGRQSKPAADRGVAPEAQNLDSLSNPALARAARALGIEPKGKGRDELIAAVKAKYGAFQRKTEPQGPALPFDAREETKEQRAARDKAERNRDLFAIKERESKLRKAGQQSLGDQQGGLFSSERKQGSLFQRGETVGTTHAGDAIVTTSDGATVVLSDDVKAEEALIRILDPILQKKAPRAALRPAVNIIGEDRKGLFEAWGHYDQIHRIISVVMGGKNEVRTLNHEIIHHLRRTNLIRDAEWDVLERAARERWLDKLPKEYAKASERVKIEEAIAEAYADWAIHPDRGPGFGAAVVRAFRRIAEAFRGLREHLTGRGYKTADDVFAAIERGEIGKRSARGEADSGGAFLPAWHGSGKRFDKFSTEHIGTGEGAQSYGWGLYFAGKKDVAEHYREQAAGRAEIRILKVGNVRVGPFNDFDYAPKGQSAYENVRSSLIEEMLIHEGELVAVPGDAQKMALAILDRKIGEYRTEWPEAVSDAQRLRADLEKDGAVSLKLGDRPGAVYKVDLAPTEDQYLDWDKPLSEQNDKVKKAVRAALKETGHLRQGDDGPRQLVSAWRAYKMEHAGMANADSGQTIYHAFVKAANGDAKAASLRLAAAGVPGIRYLDQGSRGKSDGSHNYVIFSDKDVTIEGLFQRANANVTPEIARDLASVMEQGKKPLIQRLRDGIQAFRERGLAEFRQGMLDQFEGLRLWEQRATGARIDQRDAKLSAYKFARMTPDISAKMFAVMNEGPLGFDQQAGTFKVQPGFEGGFLGIFKPVADAGLLDTWKMWAIVNRAKRLKAEGRENLIDDALIAKYENLDRQHPIFRDTLDKWQRFNKAMLDMAEQAGLVNAQQRALWERDDYVPFYRVIEDAQIAGPHAKRGLTGQRSGIKTLTGGEEKLNDIVENMVRNLTHLVDASYKNMVMLRADAMLDGTGVLTEEGRDWKSAHVPAPAAAAALRKIGVDVDRMDAAQRDEWLKLFTLVPPRDPDVVSFMRDGKVEYRRVHDPLLLRALTSMHTPDSATLLMDVLRGGKRLLTNLVTADPGFMVANLIRDTMSAKVTTGEDLRFGLGTAKGVLEGWRKGPSIVAMMAGGGMGSQGFYSATPGATHQEVRRMLGAKDETIGSRLIDAPVKAWRWWERVGAASEQANRVAIYESVKRRGGSEAEAIYQSRDLMDFSMRGDWAAWRFLIDTVPFLNARVQGLYRLARGATAGDPDAKLAGINKRFLVWGSLLTAASLALMAAHWDDPEYWKLQEYERDAYYHLKFGGQWLSIPKPFEVGAIFSTLPERLMATLHGKPERDVLGKRVLHMFRDTFAMNPVPQVAKPIFEQVANRDFFRDRPIVGLGDQRMKPAAQYDERTSETAKQLGALTGTSPKRIEHLVRGYTGTIGMYVLAASDVLARAAVGTPARPTARIEDIPVLGRFLRGVEPATATRWTTEFYDLKRDVDEIYSTVRRYRERGESEAADRLQKEGAKKLAIRPALNAMDQALDNINKQSRAVMAHKTMAPEEKRIRLDALMARRNEVVNRVEGLKAGL